MHCVIHSLFGTVVISEFLDLTEIKEYLSNMRQVDTLNVGFP